MRPATRRAVFIDSHALLAAVSADDTHHKAASSLFAQLAEKRTPMYVSDWVLAEFLSSAARPPMRAIAAEAVTRLCRSPLTVRVEADRPTWSEAFDLFRARPDKAWSLVDCTTILLCRSREIRRVLSHDHHFTQAGLEIMIP